MARKSSLVRSAPFALQCHVIKRREDVNSLPLTGISFGQVQDVRVSGV